MKDKLNPEVYRLFDQYVHSQISRRDFMDKVSVFAVGGLTVPAIVEYLFPKYEKQQVPVNDPRLITEMVSYNSPKGGGEISGLLARPKEAAEKLAGIVIVHENRGLNPHIQDVCRRAALEGFLAFAPDALSPLGGYPGTDDEGRELQRKRDRNEMLEDFIAAFEYVRSHEGCTGKVGVVGFCFGGWISNMMAVRVPDLAAAVPFYGGQADVEDVPKIQAPLMLHFGELDERVNAGWPAYEEALKANDKKFEAYIYAGSQHGFHNDTTPRYDEPAAKLAWGRTIDFFKENLL